MSNTHWDGETWPPPGDWTPAEVLTVLHYRILALESAVKMLNKAEAEYVSHVPIVAQRGAEPLYATHQFEGQDLGAIGGNCKHCGGPITEPWHTPKPMTTLVDSFDHPPSAAWGFPKPSANVEPWHGKTGPSE